MLNVVCTNFISYHTNLTKKLFFPFFSAKELFEQCNYHIQCRAKTENSHCYQAKETNPKICICKPGLHHEAAHEIPLRYVCVYGKFNDIVINLIA